MGELTLQQWRHHVRLLDKWERAEKRADDQTVREIKERLDELGLPWVRLPLPGRRGAQ